MKKSIERLLPKSLHLSLLSTRLALFDPYKASTWSQEGEDMILHRLFETQGHGFYVDVGAHHPTRYSNTCYFYRQGWHGINIDATPGSMDLFRIMRPRDINVEAAIASRRSKLTFYEFNDPALNSFDEFLARSRENNVWHIVRTRILETRTLAEVLDEHLSRVSRDQVIDFLNVDVEGLDLEVLKSNDWRRFRPKCVVVECLGEDVDAVQSGEVLAFLRRQGYDFVAKTAHTAIFRCRS